MQKNTIAIIAISFLVGIILGFIIALPIMGGHSLCQKEKIAAELREQGFLPPAPDSIDNIRGRIKKISDNGLTLILEKNDYDPFNEFLPKEFTAQTNENTVFLKIEEKPIEVFGRELAEYDALVREAVPDEEGILPVISPPDSFVREEITLAELKTDDLVEVNFGENIIGEKQALATTISVYTAGETAENEETIPGPEEAVE